MENKPNRKKSHILQIILCIAVVALAVTVVIQNRSINSSKKSDDDVTTENVAMETIVKDEATSEPMSAPAEMEIFINSMHETRRTVQTEMDPVEGISSPYDLNEEKVAQAMERQERINEKYVEASQGILSPSQVEKYKDFLAQRLDMTESILKISLNLYGGETGQ